MNVPTFSRAVEWLRGLEDSRKSEIFVRHNVEQVVKVVD